MTNFDAFTSTLVAMGFKRDDEDPDYPNVNKFAVVGHADSTEVRIGEGLAGYNMFGASFFFDGAGKFIEHGCYE